MFACFFDVDRDDTAFSDGTHVERVT